MRPRGRTERSDEAAAGAYPRSLIYQSRIVASVMAVYTVVAAFSFHRNFADPNAMAHFLKNISITGGRMHVRAAVAMVGVASALTGAPTPLRGDARASVQEIRKELLQLPYYGVFDFLAFSYDKGTVTLMGYAYHSALKHDAVRAAKRASGVDTVIDRIEEVPVSQFDDDLRWKIYYAIYSDPFLSRYAPGGGVLWGHRHSFGAGFHTMSPRRFPGMEPLGDYPLHIIVMNGKVTLLGVVDTEGDKTIAGLRAREVPGSFSVENELVVEKPEPQSTKK